LIEQVVVEDIAFRPDLAVLKKRLRVRDSGGSADRFERLVREAAAIARPRALYSVAYVEDRSDRCVVIGGVRFESRVVQVNLEKVQRAFPFLATCGMELQTWMDAQEDMLERYYAGEIAETALRQALGFLRQHLHERYRLGRTSTMSPGSLADWPIHAQGTLFDLLGDTERTVGVRLTDSFLMIPTKSVSGIRFPTEHSFASCQLCMRAGCPTRQAPYDRDLYDRRYAAAAMATERNTTRE